MRIIATFILAGVMLLLGNCTAEDTTSQDKTMNDTNKTARQSAAHTADYRTIEFNTITGEPTNLMEYDGKVVLVVNVASECGFTKQYAGLEELYRKYKDSGLVVVGFPANNFGGQEPGSNKEILKFCTSRFDVTFPMMAKVSVKGEDQHMLFTYFTEQSDIPGEIKWNFSKFIIDRHGKLVARFPSQTEPLSGEMTSKIEELLKS